MGKLHRTLSWAAVLCMSPGVLAGFGLCSRAWSADPGLAWAWGNRTYGQLGDGPPWDVEPVQTLLEPQAIAVAAGHQHSLAMKNDGTVWAWGSNSDGQLGDGTTTNRSEPIQVHNLTSVVGVADAAACGEGGIVAMVKAAK